ncbi:hypothetical protein KAS14_06070 [Candidatus Bathyarchaeota archaeon]|nr:hypothetical protein [Candidatus Bathyarchaeota archaeon]
MVSVTLSHVIGTTALISLFVVAGIYYSISYSSFKNRIIATQLEEVADYVSSNVIDLVSLCSLSNLDQLIIKELDIPEFVSETYYYNVTLVQIKDPNTQEWLFAIRTYPVSRPTIITESNLPWSANGNIMVYNGTDPIETTLQLKVTVSSLANVVAWCSKSDEKTSIGLGVKD